MGDRVKMIYYDARFCPKCGTRSRVYECCNQGVNFARYRKCPACYHTYKTIEYPVEFDRAKEV